MTQAFVDRDCVTVEESVKIGRDEIPTTPRPRFCGEENSKPQPHPISFTLGLERGIVAVGAAEAESIRFEG